MWGKLLAPVTGIISKIIDKVAGDKMSEADKAVLQLQAEQRAWAAVQELAG